MPRRLLLLAVTAAAVLATASPALAHVTVHTDEARAGGYAELTFRVPDESDTASTTTLEVHLPTDPALRSVSVRPHPGWHHTEARTGQAVTTVTWTADSAADAIHPGEYGEFALSVGPLPDAPTLTFPAVQTYSDGTVVRWIDVAASGDAEPEHPAPAVTLSPAADAGADGAGTSDSGGAGTALGAAALVVAVLAAAGAGLAWRRASRPPSASRR